MPINYQPLNLKEKEHLNRVGWFFHGEWEPRGIMPMLFDSARWGQCGEAVVAEEDGKIVGVVTLAFAGINNSGQPTIDTVYVTPSHWRQGIGETLFEMGMRRILEVVGDVQVSCDLQTRRMLGLVAKLPEELQSRLDLRHSYQYGDIEDSFSPPSEEP